MNRVIKMDEEERLYKATYYNNLVEMIGLDNYKTTKVIKRLLHISDREWRKHVENIMHLYMYKYLDKMVVGTNKGYIYTNDPELIDRFLELKEKQFKSMAYNCYNLKKAQLHKDNYSIEDYIKDSLCS